MTKFTAACLTIAALAPMTAAAEPAAPTTAASTFELEGNPIFRDRFTADPAPLVVGDTLYVYVGHDEAKEGQLFNITKWLAYSTKDMKTWTSHGPVLKPTDFDWAVYDAWASQVVEKDGKFYFYTTVQHGQPHFGKAIGVAVADSPLGPFVDARGSALVRDSDTPSPYGWDDIDPTVLIDDDGTAWMAWGNPNLYLAKLRPNMTEIDGEIQKLHVPNYTEGPWLDKRGDTYYLFYPAFAHQGTGEQICYATADDITGPWEYQGILTGYARGSYTIHPGVVNFKGQDYLFMHNATLTLGDLGPATGRRSTTAEYLFFNDDGTIRPVTQTQEGISVPPSESVNATAEREEPEWATSDEGVTVEQEIEPDPMSWPGEPALATVERPYEQAKQAISFNTSGRPERIGQTFKVDDAMTLGRVMLYAGDGLGTTADRPVTIALYDLGDDEVVAYELGENLLGDEPLAIGYQPQARGLLAFDVNDVELQAGHTYAFELAGESNSMPLFWRRTEQDRYDGGSAFANGEPVMNREQSVDFAMALYAADE